MFYTKKYPTKSKERKKKRGIISYRPNLVFPSPCPWQGCQTMYVIMEYSYEIENLLSHVVVAYHRFFFMCVCMFLLLVCLLFIYGVGGMMF